jgi:hypothetical protein
MNTSLLIGGAPLSIAVLAHSKPRHLFVALDSVFKMHGVEDSSVNVYVDAGASPEVRAEIREVLSHFDLSRIVWHKSNLGICENHLYALSDCFANGSDYALYLNDDHLLRPDSLIYLRDISETYEAFFYSLFRWHKPGKINFHPGPYNPHGIMISNASFRLLAGWLRGRAYSGLLCGDTGRGFGSMENYSRHTLDTIVDKLAKKYELMRIEPPISYIAHFATSSSKRENTEDELAEEEKFFLGPRDSWLKNVLQVIEQGNCADLPPTVMPRFFSYEG